MGDYGGVNEMQEKTSPSPDPAGSAGGGTPGSDGSGTPIKPVIPAAAAKRANASVIGMVIALVVSIAAFLPVILMNPLPKSDGYRPDIDVAGIAQRAADVAGFTPVAPDTGNAFRANYARWEAGTGNGVPTWEVGFLTPKESFIGLVQTSKANPTWLLQQTKNAPVTGSRNAGGQDWELRDTGKGEKSMVLDYRGTTVVLSGAAQLDEFAALADAVVASMDSNPAVTVSPSATAAP
ncbi:Protein of unknown function [Pseudarthrobacter enclensis]|jgi:hypothetical protein|uniref:DUF4245 domain-containing protein n=2 Tax=Pseudarthrobacter enclensis TaxID=993070 RepID=A0A0V8IJT3_9MICC|nr:hypothetical protein AS031_13545 [Pseudarthrobacter enclensis]SCC16198.1 Protein of unknown function [Pseudarthrobacter enclensis]